LVFKVLTIDQYQEFYDKWLATAWAKWFNIISPKQFWALTWFLEEKNLWNLVAVVKDGEIVAGSICLYPSKDYMVCMYGFADRNFGKLWLNHFLKFETFRWARSFGFSFVDTMWWAPTWFVDHELASVSEFKESLWWEKIEYYGNYDLVLNPLIYKFFKVYFGLRH
jgi:lipid II:glycine glycyltransferase (peptidoglycan interpeptide bridge formation enzyme)